MSSPTPQAEPVKTVEPFELDKRISSVVSGTERADLLSHTPGESTPVYVRVPLAGAIVYAHLALAWQHGFSFERVLGSIPKPWSTLLKLLGLSFTLYVAKAPLLEHVCSRLLGFTRQQTWNMRWTADNYHLLSTLVGVWAVVFGTEADGPLEIETVGVYVISIIAYLALAAYTNIYYHESYPSRTKPQPASAADAAPAAVAAPVVPVDASSANTTSPKA